MRRKDREVTDIAEIEEIIKKCDTVRIAINDEVYPYILPVNFGYEFSDGKLVIYFHGAKEGHKYELLKKNNKVGFAMDCGHKIIMPKGNEACTAGMTYESVIGQGTFSFVEESRKESALITILEHYGIDKHEMNPAYVANTAVCKIEVKSFSAKRKNSL